MSSAIRFAEVGTLEVTDVEPTLSGGDEEELAGWFCAATDPFPCPAPHCDFVALHMTAAHLILCWPEADDPSLLKLLARAKQLGRNPRVVEYEPSMGPAVSFYTFKAVGSPIHGTRWREPT